MHKNQLPGEAERCDVNVAACSHKEYDSLYLVAHPTARKWVITPVINGISRVNALITGVITHLLSGMSHQVVYSCISVIFS